MKAKEFKLATRNMVHKITGKADLIEKYNSAIEALSRLSDNSKDSAKKHEIIEALQRIDEQKWVNDTDGNYGSFHAKSYNPYQMFGKSKLAKKVKELDALLEHFGISR